MFRLRRNFASLRRGFAQHDKRSGAEKNPTGYRRIGLTSGSNLRSETFVTLIG